MKQVVCAIIYNNLGEVLGVSRKHDKTDFGLPGGKVETNEDLIDALHREIKEETGLSIKSHEKVFSEYEGEYLTHTYVCTVSGEISTQEAGIVKFVDWDTLCNGSFGEYNKKLFNQITLKK